MFSFAIWWLTSISPSSAASPHNVSRSYNLACPPTFDMRCLGPARRVLFATVCCRPFLLSCHRTSLGRPSHDNARR
ncbi:hypothetical protein R3P38DRAFT_2860325 [Favolaschia claudopus]|uniref:Secreted protein n=1 Tax=Favolaschia claudopus TaxID=2862362 RepID=A0AAW0DL09_9AGAR